MMTRSGLKRSGGRTAALTAVIGLLLALTACGGSTNGAGGGNAQQQTTFAAPTQTGDVPTLDELYAGLSTTPPTSGPAPQAGKSVYMVTCSSAVVACQTEAEAGAEAAGLLGWKATIVDGKYNAGGAWSTAIYDAIAAKADGIILYGMDCSNIQQPIRNAVDAGIKVLGFTTSDCTPPLFNVEMQFGDTMMSNDEYDYQFGIIQANYIIAKSGGTAKILTSDDPTEKAPGLVSQGFFETIKANCPGCEIVNSISYSTVDFTPNGAWIQALRAQLTRYGAQATAVNMCWDVMLNELGGAQAVKQANLNDVTVFGGFGLPGTIENIRNGLVTATFALPLEWGGYATIDEMNRAFNGQPSVPQGIGFTLVDAEHNMPAAGQNWEPDIDWRSAYLKSWGVNG